MFDWSQNQLTPEHTDALIAGLGSTSIRATFGSGANQADWVECLTPPFLSTVPTNAAEVLMIAAVGAITLIFMVMLIITRALIASIVIVGTVVLSLSFGLSVLVWQYLVGMQLHWMVIAFSVIILLAVGSDYNLLVVSRFKEEIGAGIKTGIIRAMGATGGVVTAAGLVFAVTMASMVTSDLISIGQGGTTIRLGLLFHTLVVRSLLTPSIAASLGRWFWWPAAGSEPTAPSPPATTPALATR